MEMASQWMPMPWQMSRDSCFCCGVASRRRGNHSSGAVTVQPSESVTVRESSSTGTWVARASVLALAVMSEGIRGCGLVGDLDKLKFGGGRILVSAPAGVRGLRRWGGMRRR